MTNKSQLEQEIKELIISALDLEDITPDQINSEAPLFVDGLGLDSIDALELGIALKKKYNLTLKGENGENKDNKKYFYSVRTLAEFVAQNNLQLKHGN
jgi:acyl carrier protein